MLSSFVKFFYFLKEKKIRNFFFNADKSKVMNCVSTSAAAQHIEAPIKHKQ